MSLSKIKEILHKVYDADSPEEGDLEFLLKLEDKESVEVISSFADSIRQRFMGEGIILRGIIEFSNFCSRQCFYCGLNINNQKLGRYRLSREELLSSVDLLAASNIKTVVLQSGEDSSLNASWLAQVISAIKRKFDISITLSVGERAFDDYKLWKDAGADRYLLKIETSDKQLYESMHPGMSFEYRLNCLRALRQLGYQVGSGNIIGLKNQTLKHIARDILFFKQEEYDMLGIGPFIPHQYTEFSLEPVGKVELTLKALALTRIVTKNTHLPATTALGSLNEDYRIQGLKSGANVLMPNFTLQPYRKLYEIYPGKKCINEQAGSCNFCMDGIAKSLGRFIDYTKGDSLKKREVHTNV